LNPAIIIPCFNRQFSLERLLDSIAQAKYPTTNVTLIISIDGPGNNYLIDMANNFRWDFGEKKVIIQSHHMGLKNHIFYCTNWVNEFGEIIILEDDLLVSPYYYSYALEASSFYRNDDLVAGVSLYNYQVSEFSNQPFIPIQDGFDNYFVQLPSSWGQMFNKNQWGRFMSWYELNNDKFEKSLVPEQVKAWGPHSWKKHFIHYLIDQNLFFVFPRISLTTNFEELGVHAQTSGKYQTPILNYSKNFHFSELNTSKSIYDAWFEITATALNRWTDRFQQYDYEVDLYGYKQFYTKEFLLTIKPLNQAKERFSASLQPAIQNVITDLAGSEISFGLTSSSTISPTYHLDQQQIFVVVPVLKLDIDLLRITLQSMVNDGYHNKAIILSVYKDCYNQLLDFINQEFSHLRYMIQLLESDTLELGSTLKTAFDRLKGGLVTWIQPGAAFSSSLYNEVNMVFTNWNSINGVVLVGSNERLDEYRINRDNIIHILNQTKVKVDPSMIIFKASLWNKISLIADLKNASADQFFSRMIFGMVCAMDLHPMLVNSITSKTSFEFKSVPKPVLFELLNKAFPNSNLSKAKNSFVFGILNWLSKTSIPTLHNFYYLYYDLPFIIRKNPEADSYYLFKK